MAVKFPDYKEKFPALAAGRESASQKGRVHPGPEPYRFMSNFKSYVSNLNRVRLGELIDHQLSRARRANISLSIVNRPLVLTSATDPNASSERPD